MYKGDAVFSVKDAIVTKSGILCNGSYYSCEIALLEQWFAQGIEHEARKLTVFIDNQTCEYIFIKLCTGDLSIAFKVEGAVGRVESKETSEYFNKINELKNKWRSRKSLWRRVK